MSWRSLLTGLVLAVVICALGRGFLVAPRSQSDEETATRVLINGTGTRVATRVLINGTGTRVATRVLINGTGAQGALRATSPDRGRIV